VLISKTPIHSISSQFRRLYAKLKFTKWIEQTMTGISAVAIAENKDTAGVMYSESITNKEWQFLHCA